MLPPLQTLATVRHVRAHEGVRRLSDSIVTVADIATFDLIALPGDLQCAQAAEILDQGKVSVAPLEASRIKQFVTAEALREGRSNSVAEVAQAIPSTKIIASTTPLTSLIGELSEAEHLFVLTDCRIQGIVVRADLQLPIVGMAVLGLIVTLEQALNHLIQKHLGTEWFSMLSPVDQAKVDEIYADRQTHSTDIGRIECLSLPQRLELIQHDQELRGSLGFASNTVFKKFCRTTTRMRNVIAHSGGLLESSSDPQKAISHFTLLRTVTRDAADLAGPSPNRTRQPLAVRGELTRDSHRPTPER